MTELPGSTGPHDEAVARRRPKAMRHRGFRQLSAAWVFSNAGDSVLFLMLAVWVKDLTASDSAAAMVLVTIGLPALLAPFLGQLADRVSRKPLLVTANGLMVPISLSLLMVETADRVWLIYVVTFLYGSMAYLTAAAQSGVIRDLLEDAELASGNAVLSTIDQGFRLVGPLVGAAIYVALGPYVLAVSTAAAFAFASLLMLRVEITESVVEPEAGTSYWNRLMGGFHHLARTPGLGMLTVIIAVAFGATGLINAAVFPAMERGFGVQPALLSVLVSVQGVGALVGGATSARVIGRVGEWRSTMVGLLLLGIGIIPLAGRSFVAATVGMAVIGVGLPWILVAYATTRQRLTPTNLQGRTAAAANVAMNLPSTLATMTAASVLGIVDYRLLVMATAAIVVGMALMARRGGQKAIDSPTAG